MATVLILRTVAASMTSPDETIGAVKAYETLSVESDDAAYTEDFDEFWGADWRVVLDK